MKANDIDEIKKKLEVAKIWEKPRVYNKEI